jgi:hypothetical protein
MRRLKELPSFITMGIDRLVCARFCRTLHPLYKRTDWQDAAFVETTPVQSASRQLTNDGHFCWLWSSRAVAPLGGHAQSDRVLSINSALYR